MFVSKSIRQKMGATESKKWLELMSETPTKPENKNLARIRELEDPRSPTCELPRTPIQLQAYEESPQNLELRIPDPRSPTPLITRTPLNVITEKSSKEKNIKSKAEQESEKESDSKIEESPATHTEHERLASIAAEPPTPISPGAPLTRKDKVCLLKKTVSPADYKRKKRVTRRQTVQQKLFSESVGPAPRSPLAERNSLDGTEGRAGRKGRKLSSSTKQRAFHYEEQCAGKENARVPTNVDIVQ